MTYRVRLLGYEERAQETTFGTCEICMHTGIADNPTYTFEFTDTATNEKEVRDVKGYMWDWGDYDTVYVNNIIAFGDWLEDNEVTVGGKNMGYSELQVLVDEWENDTEE